MCAIFMNAVNGGFVNESFYVPPGGNQSQNYDICVAILDPEQMDIDPVRRILLLILTTNISTGQLSDSLKYTLTHIGF